MIKQLTITYIILYSIIDSFEEGSEHYGSRQLHNRTQ